MPGSGSMRQKEYQQESIPVVKDMTTEKKHGKFATIQDKSGKSLTEKHKILTRWTED